MSENYWHPFRFNGEVPEEVDGLDYRTSAVLAGRAVRGMVGGRDSGVVTRRLGVNADVALTPDYLASVTGSIAMGRGYERVREQVEEIHELSEFDDGAYVVGGDVNNPEIQEVDTTAVQQVWEEGLELEYL